MLVLCFCSVNKTFLKRSLICNGVRVETENHASVIKTHRKLEMKAPAVLLGIAAVLLGPGLDGRGLAVPWSIVN